MKPSISLKPICLALAFTLSISALSRAQDVSAKLNDVHRGKTLSEAFDKEEKTVNQVDVVVHTQKAKNVTNQNKVRQNADNHEGFKSDATRFKRNSDTLKRTVASFKTILESHQLALTEKLNILSQFKSTTLRQRQEVLSLSPALSNAPSMAELNRTVIGLKNLLASLSESTGKVDETNRQLQQITSTLQSSTEGFAQTTETLATAIARISRLKTQLENQFTQMERLNLSINNNNQTLQQSNDLLTGAVSEIESISREMGLLMSALKPELTQLQTELAEINRQIVAIKGFMAPLVKNDESYTKSIAELRELLQIIVEPNALIILRRNLGQTIVDQRLLQATISSLKGSLELAETSLSSANAAFSAIQVLVSRSEEMVSKLNSPSGPVQKSVAIAASQKTLIDDNINLVRQQTRLIAEQKAVLSEMTPVVQSLESILATQNNLVQLQRKLLEDQRRLQTEQAAYIADLYSFLREQEALIRRQEALLIPKCTALQANATSINEGDSLTLSLQASGYNQAVLIDGSAVSSIGGTKVLRMNVPGVHRFGAEIIGALSQERISCGSLSITVVPRPGGPLTLEERLARAEEICNPQDLERIRANPHGDYKLVCDIDMAGVSNWKHIFRVYGLLHGQGHKISNLRVLNEMKIFFIENIEEKAIVRDLKLTNIEFRGVGNYGQQTSMVSGFVFRNSGTIENVSVQGSLSASITSGFTFNNFGRITGSSFTGKLEGQQVYGFSLHNNGRIFDCYFAGTAQADWIFRGFLSNNYGQIKRSFVRADFQFKSDQLSINNTIILTPFVSANGKDGIIADSYFIGALRANWGGRGIADYNKGIVRRTYVVQTLTDKIWTCYRLRSIDNVDNDVDYVADNADNTDRLEWSWFNPRYFNPSFCPNSFNTPKTHEELQSQSTFDGWDFERIWKMPAAGGFPVLRERK